MTDRSREAEVALGHGARIVAGQLDVDVREGQSDVGVVASFLGGGTDLIDEVETSREVAGEQSSADRVVSGLPVGQALVVESICQFLSCECSHAPIVGTAGASVNPWRPDVCSQNRPLVLI